MPTKKSHNEYTEIPMAEAVCQVVMIEAVFPLEDVSDAADGVERAMDQLRMHGAAEIVKRKLVIGSLDANAEILNARVAK